MHPPALRARLLGPMDLQLDDRPLPPLDSARAESLLAYLLLHRDAPQPRQHLAFLLWPGSTEGQAQTNLRKVLHTLRRALPDADRLIEIGPRTLRWRADVPLWLDVERFERAVAEDRLEEAVEVYGGELLEGRYDEWQAGDRERLAGLYADALERLARRHEQQQRWPEAIRCAERLVARDPLREESHRLLMRLCQTSGDRARAVRAYHVCASTLERELGIDPAPETRAVYESLVAAALADRTPGPPPLVGRAAERAWLAAAWRAAASGRPQLVLVTGEAGVGKSRLVDDLRAQAGAVTAEARGYPAEGPLAYEVATAWLRSAPVAARMSRLGRPDLTELSRLLPELSARATPPEPLPEAELRHRLLGAIGRALLAAGAPLLLIVDDAQWADAQSLGLIHYLIRSAPPARLLVAATARREELDQHHPLTGLTTAVAALGRLTEIELTRLSREETALLAERITGAPPGPAGLDRLYRDSEGNPLFVVEALRPDAPDAQQVQAIIAGRLARLSPQAAARSSHAYSRAVAWVWAAIVALDRGEVAEFRRHARALTADLADEGPAQIRLASELFAGYLAVLDGRTDVGLTRLRTVRAGLVSGQAPAPGLPGVATRLLLEGYALAGRPEAGLALAGEALGMGRGAELWEAEIRRLRATFLAVGGAPAGEVEAELERALAVARRQQARAFEERIRETLAKRSLSHGGAQ